MASHHYPHCHHPTTASAAAANPISCYCSCCYATYTPCHHHHHHHHHPPPPPDSHLHHPQHQPHLYSPLSHLPNFPQYADHFQERYFREERQPHPTVSSLLRRIASLESALRRRSSSYTSPSQSLRDAAARTIQAHFRAFLLRRSITLRQLKDLASIKAALGVLKSSVSAKTHFDYDAMYHKAVNLLLKLDTIQGGDPMIRNGKSSLSRELNKFLNFLDGACVERRALSSGACLKQSGNNVKSRVCHKERKMGNVKSGCLKGVNVDKLRALVERIDKLAEGLDEEKGEEIKNPNYDFVIRNHDVSTSRSGGLVKQNGGVQPKVKKNVSFVENGKVYRVLRRRGEPSIEEYFNDSIKTESLDDDEKGIEDDLCREIEEIGVYSKDEVEEEAEEGSLLGSDGEKVSGRYLTSEGNLETTRCYQDDTDDFIFSAPLPVKMEIRGDSIDKRKKLNNI